jgi:hypothetical protein
MIRTAGLALVYLLLSACSLLEAPELDPSAAGADSNNVPQLYNYEWPGFDAPAWVTFEVKPADASSESIESAQRDAKAFQKHSLDRYAETCAQSGGEMKTEGEPESGQTPVQSYYYRQKVHCAIKPGVDPFDGVQPVEVTPAREGWVHFDGPPDVLVSAYQEATESRQRRFGAKVNPYGPVRFQLRPYRIPPRGDAAPYRTLLDRGPLSGKAPDVGRKAKFVILVKSKERDPKTGHKNLSHEIKAEVHNHVVHLRARGQASALPPPLLPAAPQPPRFKGPHGPVALPYEWNGFGAPVWVGATMEPEAVMRLGDPAMFKGHLAKELQALARAYSYYCEQAEGAVKVQEKEPIFDYRPRAGYCTYGQTMRCDPKPDHRPFDGIYYEFVSLGGVFWIDGPDGLSVQAFQHTPAARKRDFGLDTDPFSYVPLPFATSNALDRYRSPLGAELPAVLAEPIEESPTKLIVLVRDAQGNNVSDQYRIERVGHVLHLVAKSQPSPFL